MRPLQHRNSLTGFGISWPVVEELVDAVAPVSGASSGIGEATARALAGRGARLALRPVTQDR